MPRKKNPIKLHAVANAYGAANLVITANSGFDGLHEFPDPVAIGVSGERISWVCSREAAGHGVYEVAPNARWRNFGDAFLMPGFHDAHLHFFHAALYSSPLAASFVGESEADCVARMQKFAATRPRGGWLLAQGWREYLWNPARMPSRNSLDAAFPEQPVALYSGDAHTLWLNSCALKVLGIDETTKPPAGGSYDIDKNGRLTGIVRETAAMEIMPRIVDGFSRTELLDAYESFQRHLNSFGITAVCDMALTATNGLDFVRDDLFCALEEAGRLTLRANLFPTLLPGTHRLEDMRERLTGPFLRACGYKQFFDGVSSQHTAWLAEPYTNARYANDCGRPTIDPSVMEQLVVPALESNNIVRIHTIGDAAIHAALDIREKAPAGMLTLEHLENFQPADIARLARLGVIASVQPRHITLDPGGPERDLGPARVPYMWPLRRILDVGATLAFGTDAPVTDPAPWKGVYTAVTRKDATTHAPSGGWLPNECITLPEALSAYTAGSAKACGRSREIGRIVPGMYADIAVFGGDPQTARPEELLKTETLATFIGGMQLPL